MRVVTRTRPGCLLLALALTAACGSTVQVRGSATVAGTLAGPNGLGGSTNPAAAPSAGTTGSSGTSGPSLSGSTGFGPGGLASGTTGVATGTGGGSATGSTGGTSSSQPGITATSVYVGFVYDKNAGAVNQAAGVGSITSGDTRANTNAVVKDINAHGGLGGRKLVPVWANFDSTSTQTLDQQDAAVCQQFTQDSPRVFAVDQADREPYRQCLSQAGVVMLSNGLPEAGAALMRRHPTFIEQGYPNLDRLAAYYLSPLVDQHYFTPWDSLNAQPAAAGVVKVGVLTYDDPIFREAVDTYLVPALKRLGYDPVVARIAPIATASDYSAQAAAVKSAQLTFASDGVTHVIPFESNGGLSTLFLPTARAQAYYPRYGVYTGSASEALLESGVVEAKQMNGAVGFGWVPALDLPAADNPANGTYSNANRRHCLQVMKDNGITFTSGNAEAIALNTCASLYLMKAAFDRRIAPAAFISTVESLGTSYQKAGGLGEDFQPGRQDPDNKAYAWAYVPACTCFRYHGSIRTIP